VSIAADLAAFEEFSRHRHTMTMMPRLWSAFLLPSPHGLSWSVFPFADSSSPHIPDLQGVYAFLIVPGVADLSVSYLMYVGETTRTLRQRFAEYLVEAASDRIRPKLIRVLAQYPDHLLFACAALPAGVVPKDIEDRLIEAFLPPCNDQVPASVRRVMRMFE
jgi:hypothetical protein